MNTPIVMCVCGHPLGDHKSGRSSLATVYGICLVPKCECREFRSAGDRT